MKELKGTTHLAGILEVNDWKARAEELKRDFENKELWNQTFDEFFLQRVNTRYIYPLKEIAKLKWFNGEGFSIMTLACALIEFLEATYQGKIFRDPLPKVNDGRYYGIRSGNGKKMFIEYLQKLHRKGLCKEFSTKKEAEQFYSDVRCGLLHEATLRGNWVINIKPITGDRIRTEHKGQILLNRKNFVATLEAYIALYKKELLASKDLKDAFIIKYNGLCEE